MPDTTAIPQVSVSPQGDEIVAFRRTADSGDSLYHVTPGTGTCRFVSDDLHAHPGSPPVWGPDGAHLYARLGHDIARLTVDTGRVERLPTPGSRPVPVDVAPDGHALLYKARFEGGARLEEFDLHRLKSRIVAETGDCQHRGGGYSPSGNYIAYNTPSPTGWVARLAGAEPDTDIGHNDIPIGTHAVVSHWHHSRDILFIEDQRERQWNLYNPGTLTIDPHDFDEGWERVIGIRSDGDLVSYNTAHGFVRNRGRREQMSVERDAPWRVLRPTRRLANDQCVYVRGDGERQQLALADEDGTTKVMS